MTAHPTATDWASLLGRTHSADRPVRIPAASGARVLVTGAGGFIGAELVRVLAASGAERIILLDNCEQHLYEIAAEMSGPACVAILGSVCDRRLVTSVFAEHHPSFIFHAAALKHVLLMEQNPFAAIETNALGTWIVARAAEAHGAHSMMLVSTDKAAAPRSIMGAAKRVAELVMLTPASSLRKSALRLVNVIGSPCSVAPIFADQIARGGPVTITHPDARRWFVTLHETVALLAEAVNASATGLLIPEPGETLPIADLANRMVAASGRSVPIAFTDPRPGEKIDEVLLSPGEIDLGPVTPNLRRVDGPAVPDLDDRLHALEHAIAARDLALMLRIVEALVPDYHPSALLREAACATS